MGSLIIKNKFLSGQGKSFNSVNPANQETLWQGTMAASEDVSAAVNAAKNAFNSWALLSFEQRYHYLEKYINILTEKKEDFARTIHLENGKPLWEARTEVAGMIGKLKASVLSYEARTSHNLNKADDPMGISNSLIHRPIGVMVVFGPFNFPGHLPNGHIIPALLAGNTVVFKPSELTPMCGELLVKYLIEAGLPEGVINLVQGSSETGQALIANPDINGVLFTGSYKVGQIIHQNLAGRPEVMLALEMGGNNPLIIDDNINDMKAAVYNTIQSAFITSGQRCTCARRLYVPDTEFGNDFINKLVEVTSNIFVSDGVNTNKTGQEQKAQNIHDPFMGPVVSLTSRDNSINFKNMLINNYQGQELLEAKVFDSNSALVSPGIISMPDIKIVYDTECFGPILQIYKYNNFDDAIVAANNTKYGLSAGLLSDDQRNIEKFYQFIRAGIVNWNRPTTGAAGSLPFGGIGHSGNYRPSAFYAADYCAYPMASQYSDVLSLPDALTPGVIL